MMLDCTPTFRVLPEAVNVPSPEPPEAEPEPPPEEEPPAARGQTGHYSCCQKHCDRSFVSVFHFFNLP